MTGRGRPPLRPVRRGRVPRPPGRAERERQFAEEVPRMREVDLDQRVVPRARPLRGMAATGPLDAVGRRRGRQLSARTDEIELALDDLQRGVRGARSRRRPEVGPLLARLAARYVARRSARTGRSRVTIDRFVEAAGWAATCAAIVVSQRVGAIKPDPPDLHGPLKPRSGTSPAGDPPRRRRLGGRRRRGEASRLAGRLPDRPADRLAAARAASPTPPSSRTCGSPGSPIWKPRSTAEPATSGEDPPTDTTPRAAD